MPKSDDFETWLRFTVPWQLGLSHSKQVAMKHRFYQFGVLARALQKKAPAEYERFFNALQARMEEVYKWRAPRGTRIAPIVSGRHLELFPNGKPMYELHEMRYKK